MLQASRSCRPTGQRAVGLLGAAVHLGKSGQPPGPGDLDRSDEDVGDAVGVPIPGDVEHGAKGSIGGLPVDRKQVCSGPAGADKQVCSGPAGADLNPVGLAGCGLSSRGSHDEVPKSVPVKDGSRESSTEACCGKERGLGPG